MTVRKELANSRFTYLGGSHVYLSISQRHLATQTNSSMLKKRVTKFPLFLNAELLYIGFSRIGVWYKHDNEDRPLFILRLGVMDVKGIIKSVNILKIKTLIKYNF